MSWLRGADAETRALRHLEQAGLKLLARNWRCKGGELDLVMRDGAHWVFVEVRARVTGYLEKINFTDRATVKKGDVLFVIEPDNYRLNLQLAPTTLIGELTVARQQMVEIAKALSHKSRVLIMDESHRYRASAGVRSINELRPLMGLEVTATPFVETTKGPVPFKNVVMDYPLARAMEDGFVKEPAVVTFVKKFKARWNNETPDAYAALGYDYREISYRSSDGRPVALTEGSTIGELF